MLIQCTKKLLDELNIKPVPYAEEEPLFSWHANLLMLNRRKTLVLVNDKNRYVIILYGLKAKELKNLIKLNELIVNTIRETFRDEWIKEEIIDEFINHSPEITYSKTKDGTSVARMNRSCEEVRYFQDLSVDSSHYQSDLSRRVNKILVGSGKNHYLVPNEELYKDLEEFSGKPIFSCKVLFLKVVLNLENFNVWRRIIVPINMTFKDLHRVLQYTFGWMDYHLHQFYVYDNENAKKSSPRELNICHPAYYTENYKPIVNIVCSEDAFDYPNDVEMKMEYDVKLSEYFPKYNRMKYDYDFGDGWQHHIEVEEIIEDYDKNYPICLEGIGNTPPEDAGGEGGYEEFLKIIADENHPEHKSMVAWGQSQGYKEFNIEMVNRCIKDI